MIKRIFCITLLMALPALAQVELQQKNSYEPPHFYFDALNFKADSGNSRLDFYFQIPYDEIQFVKSGNEFRSSYEISLQLAGSDGTPELEEVWDERPSCQSYDETTSRTISSSTQRHFIVRPGSYTLQVAVTDSETKKTYMAQRIFVARDYSAPTLSISDIMLLKTSTSSSDKRIIIPDVDGNVISQKDSFEIFYEVYFPELRDSTLATTEIFGTKNKVLYSNAEWLHGMKTTQRIVSSIPKDSLAMGVFRLNISLRDSASDDAPITANATRLFSIHFPELPLSITDIDKAADELRYIASLSTIDSIKTATDPLIKEKIFIRFWQNYNPNPSSRTNPAMEEYYNRVA